MTKHAQQNRSRLHIGACSWKYPSWTGLVYDKQSDDSYLQQYARRFATVEIDQWFWSLFPGDKVRLPDAAVAEAYNASVPPAFIFAVKVPNSITLTHHYSKNKQQPLQPNPYFLSGDLFAEFLERLAPMHDKLGPLIFQFEYLNKQKMPGQAAFLERLHAFFGQRPSGFHYAVEIRNPNYLNRAYFEFLQERRLTPVFLQGYYMPPVTEVFGKYEPFMPKRAVIRLHGPNRKEIEAQTQKQWNRIVAPKSNELNGIAEMIERMLDKELEVYAYANNHYEGSAPLTAERLREAVEGAGTTSF